MSDYYNPKEVINSRLTVEKKLPIFMLLSIGLCATGVVGFLWIQKLIRQFLLFI